MLWPFLLPVLGTSPFMFQSIIFNLFTEPIFPFFVHMQFWLSDFVLYNGIMTLHFNIFIAWAKFRSPSWRRGQTPAPPKWSSQSETFELLNIESWYSQCRKLFVRQLLGPNLVVFRGIKFGVLLGEENPRPPKWPSQSKNFELLNIESRNSQYEVVWETIVWTKFSGLLGDQIWTFLGGKQTHPPKWPS